MSFCTIYIQLLDVYMCYSHIQGDHDIYCFKLLFYMIYYVEGAGIWINEDIYRMLSMQRGCSCN